MIRVFAILLLGLTSLGAHAAIYKWVDGSGVTQYTSVPPKDRQYEIVQRTTDGKLRLDPNKELARLRQRSAEIDKELAERKEERGQAAADVAKADEKSTLCNRARENLTTLEEHTHLLLIDPESGEERRLNEEERQAQMVQTQKDIAYFCDS